LSRSWLGKRRRETTAFQNKTIRNKEVSIRAPTEGAIHGFFSKNVKKNILFFLRNEKSGAGSVAFFCEDSQIFCQRERVF